MLSSVAKAFSLARTPANFAALWAAEPETAAAWLLRYGRTAGLRDEKLGALEKILQAPFDSPGGREAALRDFAARTTELTSMFDMATLQAARVGTLGFEAGAPVPATLIGKVVSVDGAPHLQLPDGTFKIDSPAWMPSLQIKYLEARALEAFEGRTVTVRAWPAETPGVLAVEEFAPGTSSDFVSGRLSTNADGQVGVRVASDKWVQLRDPELSRRLASLSNPETAFTNGTGVILPGKVTREGDRWFFEGTADTEYWRLAKTLPDHPGELQVGHGKLFPLRGDASVPDPSGRIMVLGRVETDGRTITSKGALMVPAADAQNGVPFRRDTSVLATATPVDPTPVQGDAKGFGL